MKILNYPEREALKRTGRREDVRRAHWHRFLEDVYFRHTDWAPPRLAATLRLTKDTGNPCIPDNAQPDFDLYCYWLSQFPGWYVGPMTPDHPAWRPKFANGSLPMNLFYRSGNADA